MIVTESVFQPDPRHEFIASMARLSDQFAVVKDDVKAREAVLVRALDLLTNSLCETVAAVASDCFAQNNPLAQASRSADEKISARLAVWRKRVEQYDRNTEFRKYFGDSFLIYVYGKVKAGKSSLGNYIAYGHGDPDLNSIQFAHESSTRPVFFMRAAANSAERTQREKDLCARGKFAVGSTETTTEIQGFRLPGLTWVDSPGLHSVNAENGALSKSYADAADLILYPMHSGQPGRASDLQEIAGLLHTRKPFLVVISRCDKVDPDVDVDGNVVGELVMKSPKDRQDQTDYVRKEVLAKADEVARKLLDADVTTISTRYAEENADDPVELRESGMSGLFEKLTALTKAQGVSLKKAVPLNNLRAFVDVVLDGELSVNDLRTDLKALEDSISRQRASLDLKQRSVLGRVLLELDPAVEQEVNRQRAGGDVVALASACNKIVQDVVVRHTTEALADMLWEAQASIDAAVKFDEFKDLPEFREITKNITLSNEDKGRAIGGALGTVIFGVAVVLAIPSGGTSLLVEGLVASVVGAAGNWIGTKAGGSLAGETTIAVNIGDNTREVISETTQLANKAAEAAVMAAFKKLDQDFLSPVEARSRDIIAALEYFEITLKNEVRPNEI